MCVCVGRHVREFRLCDAMRNVCLPVGLSQGVLAKANAASAGAFARVCEHLSLPNVLSCEEIQVHDSNITPLLLLSFQLPLVHTNSHFHLILTRASSIPLHIGVTGFSSLQGFLLHTQIEQLFT